MKVEYFKILDAFTVVAGGATKDCQRIPCQGAREVLLKVSATGTASMQAASILGQGDAAGGGYFSPVGLTLDQQIAGNNLQGNPTIARIRPTAGNHLAWPYVTLRLQGNAGASPANDTVGVTVEAFVIYDDDNIPAGMRQYRAVAV